MRNLIRPVVRVRDSAVRRAVTDGRSYWQARYRDGKTTNEWEPGASLLAPGAGGIKRRGLVEARLICPNWDVGVLGTRDGSDISDRLFEFKVSAADVAVASDPTTGEPTFTPIVRLWNGKAFGYKAKARLTGRVEAQIIGLVHGISDGDDVPCTYWAWEFPGRLVGPVENRFPHFTYKGITYRLYQEHLAVKAD